MNERYANRNLEHELETFSANLELLSNFVDIIDELVWSEIIERYEGTDIRKLGCLTKMLSEIAHNRDADLENIIKGIKTVDMQVSES